MPMFRVSLWTGDAVVTLELPADDHQDAMSQACDLMPTCAASDVDGPLHCPACNGRGWASAGAGESYSTDYCQSCHGGGLKLAG